MIECTIVRTLLYDIKTNNMSYDYINDTFGVVVKTSPKYQEVEGPCDKAAVGNRQEHHLL